MASSKPAVVKVNDATTSFGLCLNHYRERELNITQTALANLISDHPVFQLSAQDIAELEQNRKKELLTDEVVEVLFEGLKKAAVAQSWDDDKIRKMYSDLKTAHRKTLESGGKGDKAGFFGEVLRSYREDRLGITQNHLLALIATEKPIGELFALQKSESISKEPLIIDHRYISRIEGGAAPSQRFIIAATDVLENELSQKEKPLTRAEKTQFFSAGMSAIDHPIYTSENVDENARQWLYYEIFCLLSTSDKALTSVDLSSIIGVSQPTISKRMKSVVNITREEADKILQYFDEHVGKEPQHAVRRLRLEKILSHLCVNSKTHLDIDVYAPAVLEAMYHTTLKNLPQRLRE